MDFGDKTLSNVKETIKRLTENQELASGVAERLDCNLLLEVIKLDIFDDLDGKQVYRELPFMLKTGYNNLFDDEQVDENIFLQGVLDMLILDGDKATIIDYKYTKSSQDAIKRHYRKQLDSYAQAVKQILKIDNVDKYVVSIRNCKVVKF